MSIHSGGGSCSLHFDPRIWDKSCSFSFEVPERLHQYLWSDCCIVYVRRTKTVMSYSAEWKEMIWAGCSDVEVYRPPTSFTQSDVDAEHRVVPHQVLPLIAADSHTCMSECFTMLMLDWLQLQPFSKGFRDDPKPFMPSSLLQLLFFSSKYVQAKVACLCTSMIQHLRRTELSEDYPLGIYGKKSTAMVKHSLVC